MSRTKHKITLTDGQLQFSRHKKSVAFIEDLGAYRIYVYEAKLGMYNACLGFTPDMKEPKWIVQQAYLQPSIARAIQAVKEKNPCIDPHTKSSLKH